MLNEQSTAKEIELQAKNTKQMLDKLNKAAYGMTFEELIRMKGGAEDGERMQGVPKRSD